MLFNKETRSETQCVGVKRNDSMLKRERIGKRKRASPKVYTGSDLKNDSGHSKFKFAILVEVRLI